jgi:urea transport system substrate-binding protein
MVISLSRIKAAIFLAATVIIAYYAMLIAFKTGSPTIKVGVLFSSTGPMRISEEPVIKATLLAINEINEHGGILGMQIEPVIADGRSDLFIFAQQAERLVAQEQVNIIFGCWLSSSRKTVKPIVEKHNKLLFYPSHYEGLGTSKNIFHIGGTFNQEVLPVTLWAMNKFGKRIFLIGTESIFPRAIEELLRQIIPQLGGEIVGSEYLKIGDERVEPIIEKISSTKPDLIINNIAGSTNVILYQKLGAAQANIPVVAYHVKETDIALINPDLLRTTYLGGSFFKSAANHTGKHFVKKMQDVYGKNQPISDVMEAAYTGVHLWAAAVRNAQSTDTQKVKNALRKLSYLAPEGMVAFPKEEFDLYKWLHIANFTKNGQATTLWNGQSIVIPASQPSSMFIAHMLDVWPSEKWQNLFTKLYAEWGNKWAKE